MTGTEQLEAVAAQLAAALPPEQVAARREEVARRRAERESVPGTIEHRLARLERATARG